MICFNVGKTACLTILYRVEQLLHRNLSQHKIKQSTKHQLPVSSRHTMSSTDSYTVLVTGGAGFLGQHIVSLLQTRADHVTNIKVLDIKPYTNKLGHKEQKPVESITGSICDLDLLCKACEGVTTVMHVAGLVSYGTFPDIKGMKEVNVKGTENVISACRTCGVERLIFCSTVDVVVGHDDIIDGTEDTTAPPRDFLFPGYPETKYQAECLVLDANGSSCDNGKPLYTMSLRANVMYGEFDPYYVISGLRSAKRSSGVLRQVGDGTAKFQPVYVGNSAWAFLCADRALSSDNSCASQAFYIPDDTPVQSTFAFMKPFLESRGFKLSDRPVSSSLVYGLLYLAETAAWIISPFKKVDLPAQSFSVKYINMNIYFNGDKARKMLGFKPIFTPEAAHEMSLPYYKNVDLD